MGVFALSILGGTYEHLYRTLTITGHIASNGKVSRKSAQGRLKICGGKKGKITQPKYNSLRYRYSEVQVALTLGLLT